MEPQRRAIVLPSGTVSYLEWDGRDGARGSDIVLLHGSGLDSACLSWGPLGSALADAGHRVIAPDHPGFGHSEPSSWASTQDRLVSYVGEFVEGLGLSDYVIGGLSLGGGMAIGHLLERPREARAAILFGSYGVMDFQFGGVFAAPVHFATWVLLRAGLLRSGLRVISSSRRLTRAGLRRVLHDPAQRTPELVDAVVGEAKRGAGVGPHARWLRDQVLWNRFRTNYSSRVGTISIPTLIVHGERDCTVPVRHARALAERIPDSRLLVVPGASPWVQRDQPEIVNRAVVDFVAEVG